MKFSIFSIIFSGIIQFHTCLVVTKFDIRAISAYYLRLKNEINNDPIKGHFQEDYWENFCPRLRQARIFTIANTTMNTLSEPKLIKYNIPHKSLEAEIGHLILEYLPFQVDKSKRSHNLLSFKCLDHMGYKSWYITKEFIYNAAFLFTIHLDSKEYEGNRQQLPQLSAIIDQEAWIPPSGVVQKISNAVNWDSFEKSIKISGNKSEQDPLCNRDPTIRYRVCAIVGDALENLHAQHTQNTTNSQSDQQQHSSLNLYIPPTNSRENCNLPSVQFPFISAKSQLITTKLLYCSLLTIDTHGERNELRFHLSENALNPSFVFAFWNNDNGYTDIMNIYVPLLENTLI